MKSIEKPLYLREMFGQQRLEDILSRFHDPDKIFDEVISSLDSFHAGKEQSDEIHTLLSAGSAGGAIGAGDALKVVSQQA